MSIYEFGSFRLDTREQVLFCAEKPQNLTPKALRVLHCLVENAGHVVEKSELMRVVWDNSIVEESNLPQQICSLRKALGDNHRGQHNRAYIETVARRGYRFVADVKILRQEAGTGATGGFKLPPEGISFEDVEKNLILQAMDQTDYNITKAAKLLGLTFRTLQYRLEKFGIKKPEGKDSEPDEG